MSSKKKLTQNIIYNGLYQAFVLLMPMLTVPYVTRIFTADDLGINSYTLSIVQIFVTLSFFGINQYGSREIAYANTNDERNKSFWEIWSIQFFAAIISLIIFLICVIPIMDEKYTNFLYIQSLLILLNIFEVSWFFIGIEEFKNVVIRNTFVRLLFTSLIFLFIKNQTQLKLYMFLNVIGVLAGNSILMFSLKKHLLKPEIRMFKMKKHLKSSSVFLFPQLVMLVYTTMDKTILGILSDVNQVAFFDQSKRIVVMIIGFITSVSTVLLPRMSTLNASGKSDEFNNLFSQAFKYTLILSFYVFTGIVAVAPSFVNWFFGPDFSVIVPMMQVTSVIGILIPLSMLLGNALLVPMKKEKVLLKSAMYASVVSAIFNFSLDGFIGAWGAVIALCSVELISVSYRLYHSRTLYDFKKEFPHVIQLVGSFIISTIISLVVNQFLEMNFIATVISGGIVTIVFFGSLIVMKNIAALEIINQVLKRRR